MPLINGWAKNPPAPIENTMSENAGAEFCGNIPPLNVLMFGYKGAIATPAIKTPKSLKIMDGANTITIIPTAQQMNEYFSERA